VRFRDDEDELTWAPVVRRSYTPKDGYPIIHAAHKPISLESWWFLLWKLKSPPRTRLLMWNIIMDKTPSGTNLRKFSFQGPSCCVLCRKGGGIEQSLVPISHHHSTALGTSATRAKYKSTMGWG